jgi:hypothetical protein
MGKSNRRRKHKVKPVNEMINYYTNILRIVADGKLNKSENEIFNALRALNDNKGLNYKRDAIDAIHILSRNQILRISKSENHLQRYDVQLAPIGDELVSLWKNIERSFTIYRDLQGKLMENSIVKQDITFDKLMIFLVKSLYVIILTLSISYIRFLSKVKDNEPANAILNYIFSVALKQGLSLPISKEDSLINEVLAQMEPPVAQYFVDYYNDKDIHENRFLERKPRNLLNSIYSVIEPEKDVNFNNLLKYVLMLKEKSLLSPAKDLSAL